MTKKKLKQEILAGKVFIYPTDTVYGLGCNALDKKAVEKIKELKGRDSKKPLSIIAPSIFWIKENCIVDINLSKYLPGPYTLILKKKNKKFLQHISNTDSLGIRIPKHKFCGEIRKSNIPFITTSVNLSGQKPAKEIKEIDEKIKNKVDYIIKSKTKLSGKPSTLIINNKEIKRK